MRPQDIKNCALLTVEGELDDISGAGQTRAAHDLCTGIKADARQHIEVPGAGHYGIFSGSRWRKNVTHRCVTSSSPISLPVQQRPALPAMSAA